jgi:hypothetical protein
LLAFFRSAAKEDHEPLAVFAEVNPLARTKINPVLVDTSPNALGIRKIALLHAC